jgi:hypothetical protein
MQTPTSSTTPLSAGRPDYAVHLAGTAVKAPLFVLESTPTAVRDLHRKQAGRAGDESPVEQLRRYTRSGRVRGNAGLLCNGWTIEAWQFGGDGDSRVVHLDLHQLAKHVTERGDDLPEPLVGALDALWGRFSRVSFAEAVGSATRRRAPWRRTSDACGSASSPQRASPPRGRSRSWA